MSVVYYIIGLAAMLITILFYIVASNVNYRIKKIKKENGEKAAEGAFNKWYWGPFKESGAVTTSWILLHIQFFCLVPSAIGKIWNNQYIFLGFIALQVAACSTTFILQKKQPFAERYSRYLMNICTFTSLGFAATIVLYGVLVAGPNNYARFYRSETQAAQQKAYNAQKDTFERMIKEYKTELADLQEKAKKDGLMPTELKRLNEIPVLIRKVGDEILALSAKPTPEHSDPTAGSTPQPRSLANNSAIFFLPADGTTIEQDENGQQLNYPKGVRLKIEQLTTPTGKFTYVNKSLIPSWSWGEKVAVTAATLAEDIARLASACGRDLRVRVEIL